jgi:poly(3-hydroxybutyrate) depolymerase
MLSMAFNKRLFLASGMLCFSLAGLLLAGFKSEGINQSLFAPGEEVRVETDNEHIGGGHFLVYVPTDYTDQRDWPAIFYYHGMNGQTKTWPFKQITDGKGFIIVGMEYIQRGGVKRTRRQYVEYLKRERRSVLEVRRYLAEHLRIDEKRIFVTGNSKGGWHTSAMLETSARAWAGAVILAAGRHRVAKVLANKAGREALRGKPIYIGVGQKDVNRRSAKGATRYYRRLGADVTFEMYKGAGHVFDFTKAKKLYDWLITNSAPVLTDPNRVDEDKPAETAK